ncbi:PIN domain-containing protein [Ruania suaedae]|uniref:type II toxin-antitoxin system VapC family toxin n=1 Tax=Ruania suaedae TaxID=2897774 RepID=UPI001E57894B|nr:PIN domain-containing protein [Ruania suaedae]UFU03847.1 PIN domain-containing protein [Ruania suaedae]
MAKSETPRVLLDSSALIAVIKDEPNADHVEGLLGMLDRGEVQLVESVVALAEVYKPSDHKDSAVRDRHDTKLQQIRLLLESRTVLLLDVTQPIVRKATEYRRDYRMKLPDAVHLATAALNDCDWLVTFDRDFPERLGGLKVVRLDHAEEPRDLPWRCQVEESLFDYPTGENVIQLHGSTEH